MNDIEKKIYSQLLDKSQEAFIMAVEVYNKPTIKYRVEGYAFFVCNAWELMLKAKLVRDSGEQSIYYKENEARTISLENCIKMVFTNEKDPLRKNLDKIIELRNTSTHYVTQEYEMVYVPLFQACAYNYAEKLLTFHDIDISDVIPVHFINLAIASSPIMDDAIKAKYSQNVYNRLVKAQAAISELAHEASSDRFAIVIQQDLRLTKKNEGGVPVFRLAKTGEETDGTCTIIKEVQNPNNTHPYNVKRLIEVVNAGLKRANLHMKFTSGNFTEFNKYFDFKGNSDFCFTNNINANPVFSYSQKTVDFILFEIAKNPGICDEIRRKKKEKEKKPTPGAKDSRS